MNSLMNAHVLVSVVDRASNMLKNIGANADSAGRKVKTLKNLQIGGFVGAAAGAASLATIAATAGKTAIDFEFQMAKVRAITNATSSDFKLLEDKAMELGGSTVWSSSEVASAMEYLGMAGWKTNQILNGTAGILNLATAGNVDLARAADISSDVMTAMGMSADQAGHFADVFAKAVTSSNTNVEMLGDTMKYTAPIARQYGLSLEETTAISAKMADAGIKSSQAGTAIRAGLLRLSTIPSETGKALDKLKISPIDPDGNMKNIITLLGELETSLKPLANSEKLSIAKGIFGMEAASGWLNVLSAGSDAVGDFTKSLENSDGAAQKMADIMSDNVSGAFKEFDSMLEKIQLNAMKPFLEPIKNALNGITSFLGSHEKLASWLLIGGTVLSGLVLVVGLIVGIASSAGLAAFSLGAMGISLGSIVAVTGGVIAGIAVVAGAAYLIYKNWDKVGPYFKNIWDQIKQAGATVGKSIAKGFEPIQDSLKKINFNSILKGIGKLASTIGPILNKVIGLILTGFVAVGKFVGAIIGQIASWWQKDGDMIIQAAKNVVDFIIKAFNFLKPALTLIFNIAKVLVVGAWENIKAVISSGLKIITSIINIFAALFTGNWSKLWENVKTLISSALKFAWNFVQLIFLGRLLGPIRAGMGFIKSIISAGLGFVRNIFSNGLRPMVSLVRVTFRTIQVTIRAAMNVIKTIFSVVLRTITGVAKAGLALLKGDFRGAFSIIKSVFSKNMSSIGKLFDNAMNKLGDFALTGLSKVKQYFVTKFNEIIAFVKTLPKKFVSFGKNIIDGLWNGIKDAAVGLGDKITNLIDTVVPGPVKKLLGINSPSRLFRQFGSWTMEGLSLGVNDGSSGVMTNVANVAKKIASTTMKGPSIAYEHMIPKLKAAGSSVENSIGVNIDKLKTLFTNLVERLGEITGQKQGSLTTKHSNDPKNVVANTRRNTGNQEESIKVELNIQQGAITITSKDSEDVQELIQAALVEFASKQLPKLVKEALRKNSGKSAKYIPGLN